jgi:hypothetical protein
MLNWEAIFSAPKFQGAVGSSKRVYFGADETAQFGRYFDGTAISENPSEEEISKYFEFWIALANAEQKEVIQAIFDTQVGFDFEKAFRGKDAHTVIDGAIKWWDRFYAWEVKEFMKYLQWQKDRLRDPSGYDRTKAWKFKGSVPQRVKQLVGLANPELVKHHDQDKSQFDKYFFEIFSKALIGGN